MLLNNKLATQLLINHMEKKCIVCRLPLRGKQNKFCSVKCKNNFTNNKHQNYLSQQQRGYKRKAFSVNLKGSCCQQCGYNKNLSALCFHHINPLTKLFQTDTGQCSNNSWDNLLKEADKCLLLYLNCHAEVPNPNFST